MAGLIDVAYVEILPDLKKFAATATAELKTALTKASSAADAAAGDIEDSLEGAFKKATKAAKVAFTRIKLEAAKLKPEVTVGVTVDEDALNGFKRDINGRLRDSRGKFVKDGEGVGDSIAAGIDNGLIRGLFRVSNSITSAFGDIGKAAGGKVIAGAALSIAANPAAILSAVAAIATPIAATFAATIPAAIATGAAAIGTLKVALLGVGDALKNIGDAEKFAESLKSLAPNAQSFAIALRDVLPQLKGIQQAVQNRFFAGFDADLKAVVSTLSGPFKAGLTGIAGEFNAAGHEVARFATSGEALSGLNSLLAGTAAILTTLRPAITPLLNAFLSLSVVAQGPLNLLAVNLAEAAQQFNVFISQAAASGGLAAFFDKAIRMTGDLVQGFINLGAVIGSIFGAATDNGETLTKQFLEMTTTLREFFATAEAKETIAALAQAMSDLQGPIREVLTSVTSLLPAVTGLVTGGLAVLTPLIQGVVAVLTPLTQLVGNNRELFTFLGGAIAAVVVVMKTYEGILAIMPLLTRAWAAAQALLNASLFANPIGITVLAIAALIGGIIAAYKHSEKFREIVDGVGRALKTAFLVTVEFLGTAFSAIGDFFSDLGSGIADAFGAVVDFFKSLPGKIADGFSAAVDAVGDFLSMLGNLIVEGITSFGDFLLSIPGRLLEGIKLGFKAALMAIGIGIGLILFAVLELPKRIPGYLAQLWTIVSTFFVNLWDSVATWTVSAWNDLLDWFAALPGRILDAIISLAIFLNAFFNQLWVDVQTRAVDAWNGMIEFFTALPGRIWSAIVSLASLLGSFFSKLWNDIKSGAVSGWNAVIDWIKSVPSKIAALGTTFYNSGLNLIKGFFNGLSAAASFAGNVGSAIFGAFKSGLNWAIRQINSGIATVDNVLPGDLPRIPQLAQGGLALGPSMIGEAGKEIALPLQGQRGRRALALLAEAANGSNGPAINFGPGAIAVSFEGVVPTDQQARQTGEAVGRGILGVLAQRNARVQIRTA